MIGSAKLEIGAMFRKKWMIRLDQLGIPYTEHRTLVESVIVIKIYTEEQRDAYYVFMAEYMTFVKRLEDLDREEARQEMAKKLARQNRFRRLTFRKPLTYLSK